MNALPPALVLEQLAALLEQLTGEGLVRLDAPGQSHLWRVEAPAAAADVQPAPPRRLTEMERNALAAACEHADEKFNAGQLAELAGYKLNAHFRSALSHLRQLHLLSGEPGDSGYQATEAGLEAQGRAPDAGGA